MELTPDIIIAIVNAGGSVDIDPSGAVSINGPKAKGRAARNQRYYERLKTSESVLKRLRTSESVLNQEPPSPPSSPPPSPPTPSPSAPTPAPTPTRVLREASADAIYQAYPRKVGRPAAIRAIVRALAAPPLGTEPESWPNLLLEITQRFALARSSEETQFTPHPSTWFTQRRFEDDPATWKAEASRPKPGQPPSESERKEAIRREAERISKPSPSLKVVPESERVTTSALEELKRQFA